jgi:hypothetical protein
MVLVVKKHKRSIIKPIIGGAYSEVAVKEKDQSKLDKLKNFSIIKTGSINDITPSQEKLNKFVSLKLK